MGLEKQNTDGQNEDQNSSKIIDGTKREIPNDLGKLSVDPDSINISDKLRHSNIVGGSVNVQQKKRMSVTMSEKTQQQNRLSITEKQQQFRDSGYVSFGRSVTDNQASTQHDSSA